MIISSPSQLPISIHTPRLILRPPILADATALNTAIIESFEALHTHMLWAKQKPSLQESETVIKAMIAGWASTPFYNQQDFRVLLKQASCRQIN